MPPCSLMSSTNGFRTVSARLPLAVTPNWANVFSLKMTEPMVMVSAEMPRSVAALASRAKSGGTTPPDPLADLATVVGGVKPEPDDSVDLLCESLAAPALDAFLADVVDDLCTLQEALT